jgi:uncharacterized protein YcfJ
MVSEEWDMLNKVSRLVGAATMALMATTITAQADSCSGHSHATGTILGAVGGGAIGGAVTHGSLGGVVVGAAAGGLAGNAISRDIDCRHRHHRHAYWSASQHRYVYRY